jgi:anti-sigma regulatory factor (Ser/Thr protein kinase)
VAAEEQNGIAFAFRELLINAIEHGGKLDPEKKVDVACIRLSGAILYYVRDPGEGFSFDALAHAAVGSAPGDPISHVAVRQAAGLRPGGFGILLTRNIADELVYNERGNEVLLVKYTPAPAATITTRMTTMTAAPMADLRLKRTVLVPCGGYLSLRRILAPVQRKPTLLRDTLR